MNKIRDIIWEGRWKELSLDLHDRLGVGILPWFLESLLQNATISYRDDDINVMYIKNRLGEAGLLAPGQKDFTQDKFFCSLHVGFLFLEETEEQLTRLRGEEHGQTTKAYLRSIRPEEDESLPTRSRIFRTQEVIQPVDRMAIRVAPGFQKKSPPSSHEDLSQP